MSRSVRMFRETEGRYLIAQVGPEDDHPWWPAWCVDGDGRVDGPRSLGSWLLVIPSDWGPAAEPLPEHIRLVARWVGSIEDPSKGSACATVEGGCRGRIGRGRERRTVDDCRAGGRVGAGG